MKKTFELEYHGDPWARWEKGSLYLDVICKFEFASNFIVNEADGRDVWRLPYWWHLGV